MSGTTLLIVAGEASGDLHGANLARALQAQQPGIRLHGVGGRHMDAAGVALLKNIEMVDAVGVPGFNHLRKGFFNLVKLRTYLNQNRVDGVVFIDNPSMNLRLARIAANIGHRVIYYIAPQIWAWGKRRIHLIKRVVHRMIVVLPFEEMLFRQAGVPCTFVGHPLLDTVASSYDQRRIRKQLGLSEHGLVLGLLPGSRLTEVTALLPEMIQAVKRIKRWYPDVQCVIGRAQSVSEDLIERLLPPDDLPVLVKGNQTNEVMAASDFLFVASGTATLQAALVGTPMIITYRLSWLTHQIVKRIALVKHIGLVNLLAGGSIVPELLQAEATSERLSEEALRFLQDDTLCAQMREAFLRVREQLGTPGASHRAAKVVLAECQA